MCSECMPISAVNSPMLSVLQCKQLVEEYAPMLFELLVNELVCDPLTCLLCTSDLICIEFVFFSVV